MYTRKKKNMCVFLVAFALCGCSALNKNQISVDYYNIYGNTTSDLDKEILRKGPKVTGGRHAVAVARIKITPHVAFAPFPGGCRVSKAKVVVDAKVTLPKWKGRAKASAELGTAWDNIDRYTRLHEGVHVAMAFRYANYIEVALTGLNQKESCKALRSRARTIVNQYLTEHDAAQKKFDVDEQERFLRANTKTLPKKS